MDFLTLLLALLACATATEFPGREKIDEILEITYDSMSLTGKRKVILILGDQDGCRGELSKFLRNNRTPENHVPHYEFPLFDVDADSGDLIIDSPLGRDGNLDILTDIKDAFAHKIIFDRANHLKIILVAPDQCGQGINTVRFSMMVNKLASILGQNYKDFGHSVGVVAGVQPHFPEKAGGEAIKEVMQMVSRLNYSPNQLNYIINKIYMQEQDHSKGKAYEFFMRRGHLFSGIISNQAFRVFRRMGADAEHWNEANRDTLRSFIFEELSCSKPVNKENYGVSVKRETREYVRNNFKLFDNEGVVKNLSSTVAMAILDLDFQIGENAHIERLNSSKGAVNGAIVASYYNQFSSEILGMSDEQFDKYLTQLSTKTGENWQRLKLEIGKLDFFNKVMERKSSLAQYGVKQLVFDKVVNHQITQLKKFKAKF